MVQKPLKIATLGLSISTLLGQVLTAPPVLATSEYIEGKPYYTFEEVLAMKDEVDIEKEACNWDRDCLESFDFRFDGKYYLVSQLLVQNVTITKINPTAETVSVYYNNTDSMMSQMFGASYYTNLTDYYLFWLDADHFSTATNDILGYIERSQAGEFPPAWLHMLYGETLRRSEGFTGEDYDASYNVFRPGQETTFSVKGSKLSENTTGQLLFTALLNGGRAVGPRDYSSCLSEYEEGMECRLVFDMTGMPYYKAFAPDPVAPSPEVSTSSTVDVDDSTPVSDTPTSAASTSPTKSTALTASAAPTVAAQSLAPTLAPTSDQTPSQAPISTRADEQFASAATPHAGQIHTESEFPWWILLLILAGIGATSWLFAGKHQKSAKNREKVQKKC